jgi:hypothetical protein
LLVAASECGGLIHAAGGTSPDISGVTYTIVGTAASQLGD